MVPIVQRARGFFGPLFVFGMLAAGPGLMVGLLTPVAFRRTVWRYAGRGFPTWRPARQRAGTGCSNTADLDVTVTRVAPGERSSFEWKPLDHLMTARPSVRGIMS